MKKGSAGAVEKLPQAQSATNDGAVTRNAAKPGELPELLQVLTDFLVTLQGEGMEIRVHEVCQVGYKPSVYIVLMGARLENHTIVLDK